jgi:hypothetical protein
VAPLAHLHEMASLSSCILCYVLANAVIMHFESLSLLTESAVLSLLRRFVCDMCALVFCAESLGGGAFHPLACQMQPHTHPLPVVAQNLGQPQIKTPHCFFSSHTGHPSSARFGLSLSQLKSEQSCLGRHRQQRTPSRSRSVSPYAPRPPNLCHPTGIHPLTVDGHSCPTPPTQPP